MAKPVIRVTDKRGLLRGPSADKALSLLGLLAVPGVLLAQQRGESKETAQSSGSVDPAAPDAASAVTPATSSAGYPISPPRQELDEILASLLSEAPGAPADPSPREAGAEPGAHTPVEARAQDAGDAVRPDAGTEGQVSLPAQLERWEIAQAATEPAPPPSAPSGAGAGSASAVAAEASATLPVAALVIARFSVGSLAASTFGLILLWAVIIAVLVWVCGGVKEFS